MIVPKSATPKGSKKVKSSDGKNDKFQIKEFTDGKIPKSHVSTVVKAAVKLGKAKKNKKSLFESDGQKIHVQITGIKVPQVSRAHMVKCVLPHKVNTSSLGVALFVKDLTKNFKDDHEPTIHHYNELIRSSNVKEHIDEVIPLRGLKAEYQTFELKRRLSNKYDKFLADKRIIGRLPRMLGKFFYGKKKMPIPIDMEAKDLDAEVKLALTTSILPLTQKGASSLLTVGVSNMKMEHVVDNIVQFMSILKTKYPGGWKNIRSIYIKTDTSAPIPLHISTISVNDVGYVDAQKPRRKIRKPEVDELSTLPGSQVKVLADGTVKVKRVKDPNWDFKHNEPFVSGSEEEDDEVEEDKPKLPLKANKNKKRGRASEPEDVPSKKFKKTDPDEDESENEQMHQNELNFMKKMALEEEEMERRNQEAPADDEIDDSKVVVDQELKEEEEEDDDLDESVVDDLCIKGESTGKAVNKSKITKPSRKERSKNVKSRKKVSKEAKFAKKNAIKAKPHGKKSFKTKKNFK